MFKLVSERPRAGRGEVPTRGGNGTAAVDPLLRRCRHDTIRWPGVHPPDRHTAYGYPPTELTTQPFSGMSTPWSAGRTELCGAEQHSMAGTWLDSIRPNGSVLSVMLFCAAAQLESSMPVDPVRRPKLIRSWWSRDGLGNLDRREDDVVRATTGAADFRRSWPVW